jgi:hypothetical protein
VLEELGDIAVMTTNVYPDVSIVAAQGVPTATSSTNAVAAPLHIATVIPEAVPHVSIEIRDVAQRQLVTAIEILSPTNKRGEGRVEYLSKRRRVLLSMAHLIELDLLRLGQHVPMQQPLPEAPYFVFLSRAENRPVTDVWPITLDQPLPIVPVPLLAGDQDALLDLQAAFTATYDVIGYDLIIDYHKPADIPLVGDVAAWADARLRTLGIRDGTVE